MAKHIKLNDKVKIRGIRKRWLLNIVGVVVLVLVLVEVAFSIMLWNYYYAGTTDDLVRKANSQAYSFRNYTSSQYWTAAQRAVSDYEEKNRLELQFLDPSGAVVYSGNDLTAGTTPNLLIPFLGGELVLSKHAVICLAITVVVLAGLFLLLKFSKWGLAVRSTASNEFTAELMGINSYAITAASWAIAGALGVLAAVMYAGGGARIGPSFMTTIQVNAFLAGILGGFSTFHGPVIGAICIPVAANCVGFLANFRGMSGITRWNMVIVYALMLIVILIKPQGLLGKPIVKKV